MLCLPQNDESNPPPGFTKFGGSVGERSIRSLCLYTKYNQKTKKHKNKNAKE